MAKCSQDQQIFQGLLNDDDRDVLWLPNDDDDLIRQQYSSDDYDVPIIHDDEYLHYENDDLQSLAVKAVHDVHGPYALVDLQYDSPAIRGGLLLQHVVMVLAFEPELPVVVPI